MRDKDLYQKILGIESPWRVTDVELFLEASPGQVIVHVELEDGTPLSCPHCGRQVPGYDKRQKRWRHLDTCQYQTILSAQIPRVECPEHKIVQTRVPWAEPGSRFTAMFESLVINWLKATTTSAVAQQFNLSWSAIDGIMQRAIDRGLARREAEATHKHLGLDEIAFKKRHNYVSIVTDRETGHVVHVARDRKKETIKSWYANLSEAQRTGIQSIAMDMWPAYIEATLAAIPDAEHKISFDKFHVAKYLNDGVNAVRKQEHKALLKEGNGILKGSKYFWQMNPENMSTKQRRAFKELRESRLRTARAWAIKETAMDSWHYISRTWAKKAWLRWYGWAIRSRLEPMKKVARMIKKHLWGILNAIVLRATNALAESINSKINMIKARCRGFRNKQRFINAIYFHLGGLDLYPRPVC